VDGYSGGGGGGGRVAVYAREASEYVGYAGCSASGGQGWNSLVGGRGSVAFFDTSVDGGGLHVYGDVQLPTVSNVFATVTAEAGGILRIPGGAVLSASGLLRVASNGTVRCQSTNQSVQVGGTWVGCGATICADEVVVDAGGALTADGEGYASVSGSLVGKGPGAGRTTRRRRRRIRRKWR
jgi:hypothetical protein